MSPTALRRWVVARLPLVLLGLVLAPSHIGAVTDFVIRRAPNPHGAFKGLLECWSLLLLYSGRAPWAVLGMAAGASALASLRGRARAALWLGLLALGAALLPVRSALVVGGALLLLLAATADDEALDHPAFGVLAWIPGSELLLPLPVVHRAWGRRSARLRAALAGAGGAVVGAAAWGLGIVALYVPGEHHHDFAHWPEWAHPGVELLERSLHDRVGDHHEVEIVGDYAIVTSELSGMVAVPLDGGELIHQAVPPRQLERGDVGSVSTFTDGEGLTWIMSNFDRLSSYRLEDGAWTEGDSIRLPQRMNFPYLRWSSDLKRMLLVEITAMQSVPSVVMEVDLPRRRVRRHCFMHYPDGSPAGAPRDARWTPSISRLVMAPDYNRWLYLGDLDTCTMTPWIDTGAFNGRVEWVEEWQRLVVPQPSEEAVLVIDPVLGVIERRIPAESGVRVVDIDLERNLLVTASVLSGKLQVRDATTGELQAEFGRMMPMVRDLAVDPERGVAIVTTWSALYRVQYVTSP